VGNAWRIARWLMTAVGVFVLLTLFVSQSTTAEAAAPAATSGNDVVYSTFACDASNNYCFTTQYNLGNVNYNYGCGVGGFNCGAFNTGVVYNPGLFGGVPNAVFTNNGCPVGNYACLGTFPFVGTPNFVTANNCPSGNFSCLGTTPFFGGPSFVFANNGCALGNFSCFGSFPFFGNSNFFFGSTGVFSGNTTVVAPSGNLLNVGPPFRVKEVAPVTTATSSAPQAAAPVAAPAQITVPVAAPVQVAAPVVEAAPVAPANVATALNAPAAAPAAAPASTSGVKILSVAPAATTAEPTGHDSRD